MLRYESFVSTRMHPFHMLTLFDQVSMATKMATVDKAEELLEKLRSASWNAAVQGIMQEIVSYRVEN